MREVEQKFSNYKPDVKLEYFDETGRKLTQKEEYKRLSHKFHGKGPGLNKIDYQKKKLEEQARVERLNAADSFMGGTAEALKERQKSTGEAFVVLTVGNRPWVTTFLFVFARLAFSFQPPFFFVFFFSFFFFFCFFFARLVSSWICMNVRFRQSYAYSSDIARRK
jgi:U4/U6.U5 tri-snRNP-associated protein 1